MIIAESIEQRLEGVGTMSKLLKFGSEKAELVEIADRLAPGVEMYLNSVWNIKNLKGEICLKI
jgi:hypothetical protein